MFSFGFQQAYQRGFQSEDRIYFTTVRHDLFSYNLFCDVLIRLYAISAWNQLKL